MLFSAFISLVLFQITVCLLGLLLPLALFQTTGTKEMIPKERSALYVLSSAHVFRRTSRPGIGFGRPLDVVFAAGTLQGHIAMCAVHGRAATPSTSMTTPH